MARLESSVPHNADSQTILDGLSSSSNLQRDRAVHAISRASSETLSELIATLPARLDQDNGWRIIAGALLGCSQLVCVPSASQVDVVAFCECLLPRVAPLIAHAEPRVRSATAKLFGDLARVLGEAVWKDACATLLASIERNIGLDEQQRLKEAERVAQADMSQKDASQRERGLRMIHETEGWRGLETNFLTVAEIISGCGASLFASSNGAVSSIYGLEKLLDVIDDTKRHPNRFVREAGLRLLLAIAGACEACSSKSLLHAVTDRLKQVIALGLQDNWSQVRYAASNVVRTVLSALPLDVRRGYYQLLLPRMCLNRHYVAEGVRAYSQKTWTEVIGIDGRVYLMRHLESVVCYFELQCSADNHAVREAACQGFAEITTKLDREVIRLHIPRIVYALLDCFKDESWPVRDHACTALSEVISRFPSEVERTNRLPELFDLFIAHLADNIVSVRVNTAKALVKSALAMPPSHPVIGLERVAAVCGRLIPKIQEQPERKFASSGRRDRDTGYGAASKLAHDNDIELHTGQIMYSCGSLAPKLRRGGGCMDHGFSRPKEPWEETDGGVMLWYCFVENREHGLQIAVDLFPSVILALRVAVTREFAHSTNSQEYIFTALAKAAPLLPRQVWTKNGLGEIASLAEACSKSDSARVASAAKHAAAVIRRSSGINAYREALESFRSGEP